MQELLTIPDNATQFSVTFFDEDNGEERTEVFYIEDRLSIQRYSMFERFRIEVGFGLSFVDLVNVLQSNIDMFDRMATGERGLFPMLVNTNYNALRGIDNATTKHPFAVWMCTLFMNTADEDRRPFDEAVMQRKIRIWEWAGVPAAFFLKQALGLVNGFSTTLHEITQMSLAQDQILNSENSQSPSLIQFPPSSE